jgi:hypothetical protein
MKSAGPAQKGRSTGNKIRPRTDEQSANVTRTLASKIRKMIRATMEKIGNISSDGMIKKNNCSPNASYP